MSVDGPIDGLLERLRRQVIGVHAGRDFVSLADAEAAVHATVREIERWLREESPAVICNTDAANQVARRFGGTP